MKVAKKGKAVVVGGSIAGLSCAHALIAAGWEVVVLEKTSSPTRCATGAGLGLDPLSQKLIQSWLEQPQILELNTLPLIIDQNQTTDGDKKKINRLLTRDEDFNFRAAYWSDLHSLLYKALPPEIVQWGHMFLSFSTPNCKTCVRVKSKHLQTGNIIEVIGDLLIAADGCLSSIRQSFFPDLKLR